MAETSLWSSEAELGRKTVINTFGADVRLDDINQVGLLSTSGRRIHMLRLDRVNESSLGVYLAERTQLDRPVEN